MAISAYLHSKFLSKQKAIPKTTNTPFHTGTTSNILINLGLFLKTQTTFKPLVKISRCFSLY
ncbi:hypothetical protein LguiB_000430 [Lonicera macranthoides]